MKKTTIRTPATPHNSFRLSRPDRAIVEKRFTLPVSRPVMLMKSEPMPSSYRFWSSVSLSMSLVTLEARLSAICLFSWSRISSTAPDEQEPSPPSCRPARPGPQLVAAPRHAASVCTFYIRLWISKTWPFSHMIKIYNRRKVPLSIIECNQQYPCRDL